MEMSSFKWKNDFSVSIQELDDQYKDIFDILGRLGEYPGIHILETDKKYGTSMREVRE